MSPARISFVLPLWHKAALFEKTLSLNDCFRDPATEVVLVLDEPSEEQQIMRIVERTKDVKFRVLVNDWVHEYRTPCIPYNVGARNSLGEYLVFTDAESIISLAAPSFLHHCIESDFRACWAGVCWMEDDFKLDDAPDVLRHKVMVSEATHPCWQWGNGFIMVPRIAFERICGYDESRTTYGLDDNDLRCRLVRLGNRCIVDGRIKIFHWWHENPAKRQVQDVYPGPNIVLVQQREHWGKCYSRVAYDWNKV